MHKVRLRKLDGTDEIVEIPGIQRAIRVEACAYLRVKVPIRLTPMVSRVM